MFLWVLMFADVFFTPLLEGGFSFSKPQPVTHSPPAPSLSQKVSDGVASGAVVHKFTEGLGNVIAEASCASESLGFPRDNPARRAR